MQHVIRLHAAAPPKPPEHQPCNGCGVCCAIAPCPLGALVSRRLSGRCSALAWVEAESVYRCGLMAQPRAHLPRLLRVAAPLLAGVARRSISAGSGCDCSVSTEAASPALPAPAITREIGSADHGTAAGRAGH